MEVRNLSDTEVRVMAIRLHQELSENYKELRGNYIIMRKDLETMDKIQLQI